MPVARVYAPLNELCHSAAAHTFRILPPVLEERLYAATPPCAVETTLPVPVADGLRLVNITAPATGMNGAGQVSPLGWLCSEPGTFTGAVAAGVRPPALCLEEHGS